MTKRSKRFFTEEQKTSAESWFSNACHDASTVCQEDTENSVPRATFSFLIQPGKAIFTFHRQCTRSHSKIFETPPGSIVRESIKNISSNKTVLYYPRNRREQFPQTWKFPIDDAVARGKIFSIIPLERVKNLLLWDYTAD